MHLVVSLCVLAWPASLAPHPSDVVVEEVRSSDSRASFELSWKNAFRDDRNHDAVWVVLKTRDDHAPVPLAASGHAVLGEPAGEVVVTADGFGAFVQLAAAHRGDVAWRVELATREPLAGTPEVWPVEVVYVPAGPYELGDADSRARELGSFHGVDAAGEAAGTSASRTRPRSTSAPRAGTWPTARASTRGTAAAPCPARSPRGRARST